MSKLSACHHSQRLRVHATPVFPLTFKHHTHYAHTPPMSVSLLPQEHLPTRRSRVQRTPREGGLPAVYGVPPLQGADPPQLSLYRGVLEEPLEPPQGLPQAAAPSSQR